MPPRDMKALRRLFEKARDGSAPGLLGRYWLMKSSPQPVSAFTEQMMPARSSEKGASHHALVPHRYSLLNAPMKSLMEVTKK